MENYKQLQRDYIKLLEEKEQLEKDLALANNTIAVKQQIIDLFHNSYKRRQAKAKGGIK